MANLLNDDDVAFLKNLSDSAAVSIAFIYSDGHWLLERHDGNQWLHDDLEQNRVARSAAENVSR